MRIGKRIMRAVIVLVTVASPVAVGAAAQAAPTPSPAPASARAALPKMPAGQKAYKDSKGRTCEKPAAATTKRFVCVQSTDMRTAKPSAAARKQFQKAGSKLAPRAASDRAKCQFDNPDGYIAVPDRFTSCVAISWELTSWIIEDGVEEIVGQALFDDYQWVVYSAGSQGFDHDLQIDDIAAWGDLAEGVPMTVTTGCIQTDTIDQDDCTYGFNAPIETPIDLLPEQSWSRSWTDTANLTDPDQVRFLDSSVGVQFAGEDPPWLFDDIDYGLHGRCEQMVGIAFGCVDYYFVPTLEYDPRSYPKVEPVAQHIYTAQKNAPGSGGLVTKWGVPPNALYRDTNSADQTANNRAACRNVVTTPGVTSCDEFPMASTYEGAAFNPDFTTAVVPVDSQNSQGGITSTFYQDNRVIDGDPFYVLAYLMNGSPSW